MPRAGGEQWREPPGVRFLTRRSSGVCGTRSPAYVVPTFRSAVQHHHIANVPFIGLRNRGHFSFLLERLQIRDERVDLARCVLGILGASRERIAPCRHVAAAVSSERFAAIDNSRHHLGRKDAAIPSCEQCEIRRLLAEICRERSVSCRALPVACRAVIGKQEGSAESRLTRVLRVLRGAIRRCRDEGDERACDGCTSCEAFHKTLPPACPARVVPWDAQAFAPGFHVVKPAPRELFSALGGISQLRLTGRRFHPIIADLPCSFHDAASPRRLASSTTRRSTAASIRFWRSRCCSATRHCSRCESRRLRRAVSACRTRRFSMQSPDSLPRISPAISCRTRFRCRLGWLRPAKPVESVPPMVSAPLAKLGADGTPVYARGVEKLNDTADPIALIRNALTAQVDQNGAVILAGLPANLLALLALPGGKDWAAKKARVLSDRRRPLRGKRRGSDRPCGRGGLPEAARRMARADRHGRRRVERGSAVSGCDARRDRGMGAESSRRRRIPRRQIHAVTARLRRPWPRCSIRWRPKPMTSRCPSPAPLQFSITAGRGSRRPLAAGIII